ncbi:uncharacterized protein [Montipora foliosa]|uniref:uncharacterized protein n=1 Tax=Montipora foliosa TaxID=591990 RepID=UPI0035F1555E
MDHEESGNVNGGASRIESHDTSEELIASARENAPQQTLENPNEEKSPETSSEEPQVSSVSVSSELESKSVRTESSFPDDPRSAYGDFPLGLYNSTSLEECNFCGSEQQVEDLIKKTPSLNSCHLFVQTPSTGLMIRMFLFERSFPERREKHFTLYIIPAEDCQAYKEIHQQNTQRGNSRQIPFAVNNSRSKEFHTCFLENEQQITVSFDIENQYQQNFVAMDDDDRRQFVFRGLTIRSESQNRLEKGAKSTFRVQCIGEPGALCQEQGVITLTINSHSSMITKLFFSISTWSSMRDHADEVQEGEI